MSMIRDLRAAVRPSLAQGRQRLQLVRHHPRPDRRRPPSSTAPSTATAAARPATTRSPRTRRCSRCARDGGFAWIGLHEPTEAEFAGIAAEFGLHPLAVEDAVHAHQRPKLERYDDTLFTVFKTVHYVEHAELTATSEVVETGEVMCFTGRDFVITVRHGGHGSLRALRHRLQERPRAARQGPLRGAARHRRPRRRRLSRGRRRRAGRHRRGGDRGLLRPARARARAACDAGPDLPAQARGPGVQAGRVAAAAPAAAAERAADAAGRPGHPEVLPGRRRPPDPGPRADRSASTNCSTRSSRPTSRR